MFIGVGLIGNDKHGTGWFSLMLYWMRIGGVNIEMDDIYLSVVYRWMISISLLFIQERIRLTYVSAYLVGEIGLTFLSKWENWFPCFLDQEEEEAGEMRKDGVTEQRREWEVGMEYIFLLLLSLLNLNSGSRG